MKKGLLLLTILLASVALFAGCAKKLVDPEGEKDGPAPGAIWDFVNYNVAIQVTDALGNDLLNSAVPGNLISRDIVVEYRGKPYTKGVETKANMPKWNGLRPYYVEQQDKYVLLFGEFGPNRNYKGETFTIDWGDGTKDTVKFDLYITWKDYRPTVHFATSLNGAPCSDDSLLVRIVK